MKIINEIPKFIRERKGYLYALVLSMEEMQEGQILVIPRNEWTLKTPPHQTYHAYRTAKKLKYTFSGRKDKENFYLMKVKFPISVEGKPNKRVWE